MQTRIIFSGDFELMKDLDRMQVVRDVIVSRYGSFHVLVTFYYQDKAEGVLNRFSNDSCVGVMIDSGAYSLYNKLKKRKRKPKQDELEEISIDEYMEFLRKHPSRVCVNLDHIGDAEKSFQNYSSMRECGFDPLPVFHVGSDPRYLTEYMKLCDYVGIGGLAGKDYRRQRKALDRIFPDFLLDDDGRPRVKLHGFGIGSFELLRRFPWYSADTQSWVEYLRRGFVLVPPYRNGQLSYSEDPWKVKVTLRRKRGSKDVRHFRTCPTKEGKLIEKYFEEKGFPSGSYKLLGYDDRGPIVEEIEDGLFNINDLRATLNIIYYCDLQTHLPIWPSPSFQRNLS
jgi:hypothetical protein